MAASSRTENQILRFLAGSTAGMVLLLALHEWGRSVRFLDAPWSADAPSLIDVAACLLLLISVQLGFTTTHVLMGQHQLVGPRVRQMMKGVFVYFSLLSVLTLSLKFFDQSVLGLAHRMLLVGWALALPLAAYPISSLLRIYGELELHLDHERELSWRLFRHTTTDTLTGLPNRLLFNDRLSRALVRATRTERPMALLSINLDRFRHVNNLLGHEVGDQVLQAVAGRLSEGLRSADAVCRVAGDEFLAYATDLGELAVDVPKLAERLCDELSRSIRVNGHEVSCTVSIGVSLCSMDGVDVGTLVKRAQQAMQTAKEKGCNGFSLYSPDMQQPGNERVVLEAQLRQALTRGELYLEYQPQVDASTGQVVGAEALVRWKHPERGIMNPAQFIPVAEDSALIVALDRWVLKNAVAQLSRWRKEGFEKIRLSVNLSAKNFYREDLPALVEQTLAEHGIPGAFLELEITESTLMSEAPSAVEVLKRLRTMGIQVGIDDFGTGYSSLGYLNRFPVDGLKIDRTLVMDVSSSAGAAAITTAVIAIGRSLNLRVIAEAVETQDQLNFLQKQGCDLIQGFFFSRPLQPSAFEGLLRDPQRLVAQKPIPAKPPLEALS